jgi:hypothetical protein
MVARRPLNVIKERSMSKHFHFLATAVVAFASITGSAYAAHPNVDTFDGMNRLPATHLQLPQRQSDSDAATHANSSGIDRYDGMNRREAANTASSHGNDESHIHVSPKKRDRRDGMMPAQQR